MNQSLHFSEMNIKISEVKFEEKQMVNFKISYENRSYFLIRIVIP